MISNESVTPAEIQSDVNDDLTEEAIGGRITGVTESASADTTPPEEASGGANTGVIEPASADTTTEEATGGGNTGVTISTNNNYNDPRDAAARSIRPG
jgi:hypothetical protein